MPRHPCKQSGWQSRPARAGQDSRANYRLESYSVLVTPQVATSIALFFLALLLCLTAGVGAGGAFLGLLLVSLLLIHCGLILRIAIDAQAMTGAPGTLKAPITDAVHRCHIEQRLQASLRTRTRLQGGRHWRE